MLNAPNCALKDNSSSSWGGHLTSNSHVTVADATFTGGYIEESSSVLTTTSGQGPFTGAPPAPDPFCPSMSDCLEPPFGGAPYECGIDPVTGDPLIDVELDFPVEEYGPITLWPGVYCGKFTVKNSTHVILPPGMYVMQGGEMKIEGDAILEGEDVTLYFTESNDYELKEFSFSSNARALLSAPDDDPDDPYYGILLWVDGAAGDPDTEFKFESNTESVLTGSIYMPNHIFNIESSTVINSEYLIIVVRRFIGESNSVVNMGTNFPAGGSPLKRLALVE